MPLISLLGWVSIATVLAIWATVKLVKWSLNAEGEEIHGAEHIRTDHVNHIWGMYRAFLAVALVLSLGEGLAGWLIDVWHFGLSLT